MHEQCKNFQNRRNSASIGKTFYIIEEIDVAELTSSDRFRTGSKINDLQRIHRHYCQVRNRQHWTDKTVNQNEIPKSALLVNQDRVVYPRLTNFHHAVSLAAKHCVSEQHMAVQISHCISLRATV